MVDGICDELTQAGVDLPTIPEKDESRAATVAELKTLLKTLRLATQGKRRVQNLLAAGGNPARAQERKLRAATKREIDMVMERPSRGTIETVSVGQGEDLEVMTDPTDVARVCCSFGTKRMGSMQPKWFRKLGVAIGHRVWACQDGEVVPGVVTKINDDGDYVVTSTDGEVCHCINRT